MASSTRMHIMTMKARTKPASLYFKFVPAQQPVGRRSTSKGENSDKIVAHDVGTGPDGGGDDAPRPQRGTWRWKRIATPSPKRAWRNMIDTGQAALGYGASSRRDDPSEFHPQAKVGDRALPDGRVDPPQDPTPEFLFHKVKFCTSIKRTGPADPLRGVRLAEVGRVPSPS